LVFALKILRTLRELIWEGMPNTGSQNERLSKESPEGKYGNNHLKYLDLVEK
jgi:hypothetical protein